MVGDGDEYHSGVDDDEGNKIPPSGVKRETNLVPKSLFSHVIYKNYYQNVPMEVQVP
jgi:hypothetical protein